MILFRPKSFLLFPISLISLLFFLLSACSTSQSPTTSDKSVTPTLPMDREFRAAWVATVANINWPSRRGLPVDSQKIEARLLLDTLAAMNFNAVIFQVRPQADALYPSDLEPWSYYLTGEQGKAPFPFYDPLQFWIDEAHKRGLQLHAWLNPYRAHHTAGGPISEQSMVKQKSELVLELSSGFYWFDPSQKETQRHGLAVVEDIVHRYDVDGIHFDDYFYPYPSYHDADFPDDKSWQAYINKGGKLSRGDWRRKNVNTFVKDIYSTIKSIKPHVLFGLSPFGIWRPGYPASIQGFDQYEKLYADAKLWLNEGWIDYFAPQLYWPINQVPQSYPILLGWWESENNKARHLWPGISIGRGTEAQSVDETLNQILISRAMLPNSPGIIHWSIGPLLTRFSLSDTLMKTVYKRPALIPSSPWLSSKQPSEPQVQIVWENDRILLYPTTTTDWIVTHARYENQWVRKLHHKSTFPISLNPTLEVDLPNSQMSLLSTLEVTIDQIYVTNVDRFGNESKIVQIYRN